MADDIVLNSGSGGSTVATDQVAGGQHYQRVKLTDGTADSTTVIAAGNGTSASALRVTVSSDSTGVLSVDDNGSTLSVDDGAGSLTVDNGGTFAVQAAQSGAWNITNVSGTVSLPTGAATAAKQPALGVAGTASTDVLTVQGIASMTALLVDGSAVTQPVSHAALTELAAAINSSQLDINIASDSVGIGGGTQYTEDAAAAANPTGNAQILVRADTPAGVASADGDNVAQRGTNFGAAYVQVVDSSGNFVDSFSGSGGTSATDDAAFTAASGSGTPMMGFATSDAVNAGDVGVVGMDTNRNLKVSIEVDNVGIGGGTQYTEDAAAAADPVGNALMLVRRDTLSASEVSADGDNVAGKAASTGAQYVEVTAGTTKLGDATNGLLVNLGANNDVTVTGTVTVDASGSAVPVTDNGGALTVDNGGTFAVQVDAALPAGTNAIGKLAANSGVDIGDVTLTAGSALVGDVGISGARTSGGTTLFRDVDVDETEDAIKASAGQLYWIHAMNMTASVLYLQIYNATVANVVVGTTTPDLTFPLPTLGDTNGAGFVLSVPNGIAFSTAITIACTTTITGSTGPAANGCIVNAGYA